METIPIHSLPGLVAGYIDEDQPLGTLGATDALARRLVVTQAAADSGTATVVELRDASGVLGTLTLPAGDLSAELSLSLAIAATTALYLRPTSAGSNAFGLAGFLELDPLGSAAALSALTTVDRVKTYLGIVNADSDALLAILVNATSARIQTYLRRAITLEGVSAEIHSPSGKRDFLQLRAYPLVSVSALTIDGAAVDVGTEIELDLETARVYYRPSGGELSCIPEGRRSVSIDYSAGFAAVPDDLTHAATIQTAWAFKQTTPGGDRLGLRDNVLGEGTGTFLVDAWSPEVADTLARYRRWLAA